MIEAFYYGFGVGMIVMLWIAYSLIHKERGGWSRECPHCGQDLTNVQGHYCEGWPK